VNYILWENTGEYVDSPQSGTSNVVQR